MHSTEMTECSNRLFPYCTYLSVLSHIGRCTHTGRGSWAEVCEQQFLRCLFSVCFFLLSHCKRPAEGGGLISHSCTRRTNKHKWDWTSTLKNTLSFLWSESGFGRETGKGVATLIRCVCGFCVCVQEGAGLQATYCITELSLRCLIRAWEHYRRHRKRQFRVTIPGDQADRTDLSDFILSLFLSLSPLELFFMTHHIRSHAYIKKWPD